MVTYGNLTFDFPVNGSSDPDTLPGGLVSNHVYHGFLYLNLVTLAVTAFGTVANVLNMIVFVRLGFRETMNLSLFNLALSDLCTVVIVMWCSVCVTPWYRELGWPFLAVDLWNFGCWFMGPFTNHCCWIAVFITIERCLCVTKPLKVKLLVTREVTVLVILASFALSVIFYIPWFATISFAWTTDPDSGLPGIGLMFADRADTELLVYISTMLIRASSFPFLFVATIALVVSFNRKGKWRQKSAATSEDKLKMLSNRDSKVVKMVVAISSVILVSNSSYLILSMVASIEPQFEYQYRYSNIHLICWYVSKLMFAFNSSVNIFFYYSMSSSFKSVLRGLLLIEERKDVKK